MSRFYALSLAAALAISPALAFAQTPAAVTPPKPTSVIQSAPAVQTPAAQKPVAAAVPSAPPVPAAVPAAPAVSRVDINTATVDQLDTLPGVGPATAAKIVKARPYTDPADLVTKKVITQSTFDGLKGMAAIMNVNTASATDMAQVLPGIGAAYSQAIVDARKKKGGKFTAIQDLVTTGAVPQSTFDKIKTLITVG